MDNSYVLTWEAICAAEDLHGALIEHFRYLADTPGFEPVLEALMKTVISASVTGKEGRERLTLELPGGESLTAGPPDADLSESYPLSFRSALSQHSFLHFDDAMITLGEHGLFDSDWWEDLEEKDSELVEYGFENIVSPMFDYSDLWLYHPGSQNPQGEPRLYYLSHEGGDICDPQDWNIGSLFLARAADVLDLDVELPEPALAEGVPDPAEWWSGLSDAWKAALKEQFEIEQADDAHKAFKQHQLYIPKRFQIESLEPLRALRNIQDFPCESELIDDLSPLADLPELSSIRLTSKAIKDFSPLARCSKLTSVTLSGTELSDLGFASALGRLERLECDDTAVSDLSPLAALGKLNRLSLARTQISDLAPLAGLKKLDDLDITGTQVDTLEALSGLSKLSTLDIGGTKITTLAPLANCNRVHILHCENTNLSFAEQLEIYAASRKKKAFIGLTLLGDCINSYYPDKFADALEQSPPDPEGYEEALAELTNDCLIAFLKREGGASRCEPLLQAFFALPISGEALSDAIREELAGNALVAIGMGLCSQEIERLVFGRLVDKGVSNSRLALNLACYWAKRRDKAMMLRYVALSLQKGHDRERFRADADFAAYFDDPDFVELLIAPALPDPEKEPLEWWRAIPEGLRRTINVYEETEESVRECLHHDDFQIQLDDAKSLEPLRNLRGLKRLTLRSCKALSLDAISTLTGLERFECEKSQYDSGVRYTDASPLASLTNLQKLNLTGHAIADLSPLAGLTQLQELRLTRNPAETLAPLKDLVKLENLFVICAGVIDCADLAALVRLRHLSLQGKALSLEGLSGLTEINHLWLGELKPLNGAPFSLAPLAGMKKLKYLHLGSTPVESLEPLFALPALVELSIDEKRAQEVKVELKAKMPRCRVI